MPFVLIPRLQAEKVLESIFLPYTPIIHIGGAGVKSVLKDREAAPNSHTISEQT